MNRRLLILDDEQDLLDVYESILAMESTATSVSRGNLALVPQPSPDAYELFLAKTGEEALELVDRQLRAGRPFAGGFFDVKLGAGIDGVETIRRIKEADPQMLCVIVTGFTERTVEEIQKIFGDEFSDRWDFMVKPFSVAEIKQKAHNIVCNFDRRRREREYVIEIQNQSKQLIESEKMSVLGSLARGMGLEFSHSVQTILSRADIALGKKTTAEYESALRDIVSIAEQSQILVRNLQTLVRMETSRESMSLLVPLKLALGLLEHEFRKNGIEVRVSTDVLPNSSINRSEFVQAFLNVLLNAVQSFNGKRGIVEINTKVEGESIGIAVRDHGLGIPSEDLGKIFEPLFTTKGAGHSGLGLSVARRIAHNHGGKITVESEIGKGSTFILWVPKR